MRGVEDLASAAFEEPWVEEEAQEIREQTAWLKGLLASGGPLTHRHEDIDMVNSIIFRVQHSTRRK